VELKACSNMLNRYFNYTMIAGALRACAVMSTTEYCREHRNRLFTDDMGKCMANGVVFPVLWPLCLYTDARKLEVYLRKKNPDEYSADSCLLLFDYH
jgi:hypothetical protein